jgi:cobalt-zinc-cadmium efflux system outer membrane protein
MSSRFVATAILIASASIAHAQTAPSSDLTVEQAVAMFRERSPRVAAANAAVGVAAADIIQAGLYPNPEVGISSALRAHGDTAGPDQQYQLDVSIPILIGNQRHHRRVAAEAHVAQAHAEVTVALAEDELEIRDRFADLLGAQEQVVVLQAALADARTLRDIVAGRTNAGAGSPYAVERIDLAIASLESRVDASTADVAATAGALAVAIGVPDLQPHAVGALAPAPSAAATIDADHPALAVERVANAAARADEAQAKADAVPTPSLGLQAAQTLTPGGIAVGLGVSMPLPFFDRNQGAVARARAEAHRAEAELAAKQNQLSAELARAERVLAARRDTQARFQTAALQRLPKVREMAEASYRAGQGSIVELLDALSAITEARMRDIELRLAIAEAELDVRRAALGR